MKLQLFLYTTLLAIIGTNLQAQQTFGQVAAMLEAKQKLMHNDLARTAERAWTDDFIDKLEELDFPGLTERIKKDAVKHPEFFKLYPKLLPSSGYNTMTKSNLADYPFAMIAAETEDPPTGSETTKFLNFYKEYCIFKGDLLKNKSSLINNIRTAITATENEHPRNKYGKAKLMLRSAKMAHSMLPEDLRLEELKDEAEKVYYATLEGFGKMLTGDFHRKNLEKIVIFKSKPSIGKENAADVIDVIIPGQEAYITGYFTATNKDAGGIPSLLVMNPENSKAKEMKPWPDGAVYTFTRQPMFDGPAVKEEFLTQAYFVFNLFPDVNSLNYSSHVQYFPLMNLLKWLRYQPAAVIEVPLRFGMSKGMATGKIKIDLSGDNKQKLDDYYKKLEAKQLSSVTFPDMEGCTEAKASITNYSDLSKYGTVLKTSLSKGGDIMKPFPNDHEVEFNTAKGFAAVEKSSGKVEIIPLEFRKAPSESKWQFWSVGSIPRLFPMQDEAVEVNAVKKLELGYEIEKANVSKCSTWY